MPVLQPGLYIYTKLPQSCGVFQRFRGPQPSGVPPGAELPQQASGQQHVGELLIESLRVFEPENGLEQWWM